MDFIDFTGFTGSKEFTGFGDYYKDCYKGLEACKAPVRTRKELQKLVERLQVSIEQVRGCPSVLPKG
jgi:hypothetical protein